VSATPIASKAVQTPTTTTIGQAGGKGGNPWWTWTKGVVMHSGDRTASRYAIKEINGARYMFFEWKSGDYTIRGNKPEYYVLKKE